MRIIDKNTDFYDYLQNIYLDRSVTFDRTDSFLLTKDIMCSHLGMCRPNDQVFVLLQACYTFWLFLCTVTARTDYDCPSDYKVELLAHWQYYHNQCKLLNLSLITFDWNLNRKMRGQYDFKHRHAQYDTERIRQIVPLLCEAVNQNNITVETTINQHTVILGDGTRQEKHIPLLKASGLSAHIDPLDLYLALEAFFTQEKQSQERTCSIGYTDTERIEAHGFDRNTSFRGKPNK